MKNAIWLPGYQVLLETADGAMQHFLVDCATTVDACPSCGVIGRLYRHGTDDVTFRDIPSFGKRVEISVRAQRWRCRECGATANQPLPGMDRRRRMTERCVEWIAMRGVTETFSAVAREVGVDEKTVRNICVPEFRRALAEPRTMTAMDTPFILGIDELMLDGEMRAIFMDVGRSRVLDVIDSHQKWKIARWLHALPLQSRMLVQVVTIDMTPAYRDVAKALLPSATVVIDKFHVVRCANQALDQVRNRARRSATGAGRKNPWRGQRLLRKHARDLSPAQEMEVDGIIANNPLVKAAYETKERFYAVWRAGNRQEAERLFDEWRASIPEAVEREFGKVAKMVERWRSEVFAYFDFAATNAVTENRNGLIKMLNRNGRGYTFDMIRAKAILTPPLPKTTRECPMCKHHAPARGFAEVRRWVAAENDEYVDELCGSCHFVFTKMYAPLANRCEAANADEFQ